MLIVMSMLVFIDDIFIVWSDEIGNPRSFHMYFGIVIISGPESRTP